MKIKNPIHKIAKGEISKHQFDIIKASSSFDVTISLHSTNDTVNVYTFNFSSAQDFEPVPVTIKWKIPALNVKGFWKPTSDYAKRVMYDWELNHLTSSISVDAPVVSIFGQNDDNILTFSCSDAINTTVLNALYREEDNNIYCHITFFPERHHKISSYTAQLRIDQTPIHFSRVLNQVSLWWGSFENLQPTHTPALAQKPVYSTWYQFHQNLDAASLIKECSIAKSLGYDLIILDDGWQTHDNNRGYDYTGDWCPKRIPDMASFVKQIHNTGMKIALWYSVPFCGKKSKAYVRFKGKFLTENHRWAPVFDPRYPEVRSYLINLYSTALEQWNLDGFKLDFIDEFKNYPEVVLTKENGRDFASVNEAVDQLLSDIKRTLHLIKKDVVIEFRQKYTGPAMRKYGNMFRAFDCPGDPTLNRIRIADIKMLCNTTAVHADMLTYHTDERLENKALQFTNTLFGVPQVSVLLQEATEGELKMIAFYTKYWNEHSEILLKGTFTPIKPLANYPVCKIKYQNHIIIGIFDNCIFDLNEATTYLHIVNSQLEEFVVVNALLDFGMYKASVFNCLGNLVHSFELLIKSGLSMINVPPCGIVTLEKAK